MGLLRVSQKADELAKYLPQDPASTLRQSSSAILSPITSVIQDRYVKVETKQYNVLDYTPYLLYVHHTNFIDCIM